MPEISAAECQRAGHWGKRTTVVRDLDNKIVKFTFKFKILYYISSEKFTRGVTV